MWLRSLSLAVLALVVAISWGQFMPGQIAGRGMIVMNPDCAKELKITKDQRKQFEKALEDMQKRAGAGDYSGLDVMNPFSAIDKCVEPVLDETQKMRLEELFIQKNLGFAMTDKRTAERLVLTEEQIAKVREIEKEAKPELMKMVQGMRSNGDIDKIKKKEAEYSVRFLEILVPDQKLKFEELKGKEFKFKK